MKPLVDLVVLARDAQPLHPEVERGIRAQEGVELVVHRVVGSARSDDRCRWDAIARARNEGKLRGRSPWLMFLDDDVVLEPGCVATLVAELSRRTMYGALAADYLGQRRERDVTPHVAMGATLFRREAIDQIVFTWRDEKCECQCCCDDLRRRRWAIEYCPGAKARHLPKGFACQGAPADGSVATPSTLAASPRVLTTFDRRHLGLFRGRFLASLRLADNNEIVTPVAVGLYPTERQRLAGLAGVRPVFLDENGQHVARRRLRTFGDVTSALPPGTPVAYWDAGDVIFQSRLGPLWDLVRAHPDKLLAAREPIGHPENAAVVDWTKTIADRAARRRAQEALFQRPFLNGGFAAGTAAALTRYFRTVANWYETPPLAGSLDWGDQIALNVYCHTNPDAWLEVPEGWNFCLCGRNRRSIYRRESGRYVDVRGVPVHVVHGNARTLEKAGFRRRPF